MGKHHDRYAEDGKNMAMCIGRKSYLYDLSYPIVKIINYLRSKGYDCDNLIEQGIAIDKTKI